MGIPADLIITNASVFTSDESNPKAEAVAVSGNKIVYVGTSAGAEAWRGPSTRVIDGQGHTLTPGFIDAHFHLLSGALWMGSADLESARIYEDVISIVALFSEKNTSDEWVVGQNLRYGIVSTRQQLDAIVADRPAFLVSFDWHTAWANTKALEKAGILEKGDAKGNGLIVRDESGLATGELRETAMNLVYDLIPLPSEVRKRELFQLAVKQIHAAGVTSVHNMNGDLDELTFYAAREDTGELTLRVYTPLSIKPEATEADLQEAAAMARIQGEFARGGAVKFFMDGVWESYTALTLDPYADRPEANPKAIFSPEKFNHLASAADKLGLQIFVHCCGDAAVRRVLDGYEFVQKRNGKRDSRHRVEHVEVVHPEDIPRFHELGVIASMQASHAPFNLDADKVWPVRVGAKRWPLSFAWRELKKAGARLVFGSDWTVAPFDPLAHIYVAMNRERWSPSCPDQRLTLEECLLGYTHDAAYAEFNEHKKGQIKEGYLADLTLFSHDLFQLSADQIKTAKVVMTIVDGDVVFDIELRLGED